MGKREKNHPCGHTPKRKSQGSAVSGTFFISFILLFVYITHAASIDIFSISIQNKTNIANEPVAIEITGPNSTNFTMNIYQNHTLILSKNAITSPAGRFRTTPNFTIPGRYTANLSKDNIFPAIASAWFSIILPNTSKNNTIFLNPEIRESQANESTSDTSQINRTETDTKENKTLSTNLTAANNTLTVIESRAETKPAANNTITQNITTQTINTTAPEITPSLSAGKKHFTLDENPSFDYEYTPHKEIAKTSKLGVASLGGQKKAIGKLATGDDVIETSVYYNDKLTGIQPHIEKLSDSEFIIEVPKKRSFRAGTYKLKVQLTKDNNTYIEEQEFQWGLVSLNTKKSIYKPGETAESIIVVLDKYGHPLCNADIRQNITNPYNEAAYHSTGKGTITSGSECGIYNTRYQTETEGNHTIDTTAIINGIEVSFSTNFLVRKNYEFDIIRTAKSKIDPTRQDWFDVAIDIESFTGANTITVREFVPAEFDIISDAGIRVKGDTKILAWNKDLIRNKTSVSYSYSVPHIWPYLYALGRAEIKYNSNTFTEARPWYIAVDPEKLANGNFTSDLTSWSKTISGDLQIDWDDTGSPQNGSAYGHLDSSKQVGTGSLTQTISLSANPDTANISFKWKKYYYKSPDMHTITVELINPSDVNVWSWTHTTALDTDVWTSEGPTDVKSDITTTGNWKVKLYWDLDTPNPAGAVVRAWFDNISLDVNYAPQAETPKTYNSSSAETSTFEAGENITIRVNVTDTDDADDLDTTLITITNPQSTIKVDNATMTNIGDITNGHTYEYNYTAMPKESASAGDWSIDIYANDTSNARDSNSTTFEGIIPKINVTTNTSYLSNETVNASGTFFYTNGDPLSGKNVTVEFINTSNAIVQSTNVTTDSSGKYSKTWDIPFFSASGTYRVNVTAPTTLNTATNTTTFTIYGPIYNITTDEPSYNSSDIVNASGWFGFSNRTALGNENVTVTFINTTGGTIQSGNVTTCSGGNYNDTWTIPSFIASGTYIVNVTVYGDSENRTNTTTFPVYGATYGAATHAPPTHTSSSITQTSGDQFDLTVTFENQGPDTAISANISLVNSTGITLNSTFEECGDIASGSTCIKSFEVTIAPATAPGTYWVNSTTEWLNNNTATNSTNTTTEITVNSNPVLEIPETEILYTVNHSKSKLAGNFTVNSTGNDALNSINFYAIGGNLPLSWLTFDPSTIPSLNAGNTQNINVTVSIPPGQAPALYWTNLTINSTEGKEDWLWLNITVPTDDSWTRAPIECEAGIGINQTGTLCIVTVNNTGNVLQSFNVTPDTTTNYTKPDKTEFNLNPWSTDTFNILYNSTDADVGNYTVTYNITGNGTPYWQLIDVNLTIYNYTLAINIISPSETVPSENRTAGETLQIRANASFSNGTHEWEENENMTWETVYLDTTECPIENFAFDSVADNWQINCTLPDITDAAWYGLTLEGKKTPQNITSQGKETNAVHYKDITSPTISSISVSPAVLEIHKNATIAANVTDNVGVDEVWAEITGAATVNMTMSILRGNRYFINYTPPTNGTYYVRIYANDTPIGNLDNTSLYQFAVYNATIASLGHAPYSVNVPDVTWTDSTSFEITLTFHNTGNTTAYSTNITIEKPASWNANSTFEKCGDIAKDATCIKSFNITVPKATAPNTFYINGTAEWRNPDSTTGSTTNQTTVNVISNPALDVPETSITETVNHNTEETVGSFTVNSTGNDALATVQFDCISGNLSSSWVEYTPGSISSQAAGTTQSVDINVTVPAGQTPGDYYCKINATSSNDGSGWLWLNITVPLDDSWTRTPPAYIKIVQPDKTGTCTQITIDNTGNVPLNFSIDPSTLTNYTEPDINWFTLAAQGYRHVVISYDTTGATVGETKITNYNISSNSTGTPYQLAKVTLTIIDILWWNSSWTYRTPVDVTEPGVLWRTNWPVDIFINTGGNANNCTKEFRALDDENNLIPYTVYNETYSLGKCQSANIVFLVNETQSETRTYYVYYGNPSATMQAYSIWQDNCSAAKDSLSCATIYYSRRTRISSGLDTWNKSLPLNLTNEDNATRTLPWTFNYFNQSFSSVHVHDNGYLDFTNTTADPTPSQAEFTARDMIAALWDDYDTYGYMEPLVNGDFASADNWTLSGTATTEWDSTDLNMHMYEIGNSQAGDGYADQDFTYTQDTPPINATLNFSWFLDLISSGDACAFYVKLTLPNTTVYTVWSSTGHTVDVPWTSESVDITSYLTGTGTYTLRLHAYVDTDVGASSKAHARWDNVNISINYATFDVYENQQSSPGRILWTWDTETDENLHDARFQSVLYSTGDIMLHYGTIEDYDQPGHLAGISKGDSLNYLNNPEGNNENTAFYQFSGAATTDIQSEEKLILPNITGIAIYDVTGQPDTHTGGTLVKSAINSTFGLFADHDLHSRGIHRIEINVTANASWTISANTIAYHENLDSSWLIDAANDIWYTNGTQDFPGGTFSSGKVTWTTSGGHVAKDEIVTFAYVVNLTGYTQTKHVHFFINETDHTHANSLSWDEDHSTYNLTQVGYLQVALITPPDNTLVPWQRNFTLNTTVYCRSGDCWNVHGYARYNESAPTPDTTISTSAGDTPFYINSGKANPQSCGSMLIDDYCNLFWVINSTGNLDTYYEIETLFNSTLNITNSTQKSTITIGKILLMTLGFTDINFGVISPPDTFPALNNADHLYNITLDANSNDADGGLWIKGENLTGVEPYEVGVSNMHWNATTHAAYETLEDSYQKIQSYMYSNTNTTTYYWVDTPLGTMLGTYTGKIYFMVNTTY